MQAFKIDHYERQHGPGTFVPFRHLADAEARSIREKLRQRLKLPLGITPKEIVRAVFDKSSPVKGVNAEQEDFDLREVLRRLQFDPSEFVYLNWYHYDDIDEIRANDIFDKFSDIWYHRLTIWI